MCRFWNRIGSIATPRQICSSHGCNFAKRPLKAAFKPAVSMVILSSRLTNRPNAIPAIMPISMDVGMIIRALAQKDWRPDSNRTRLQMVTTGR